MQKIYKNVDDILTAAPTPGDLEEKMKAVFKVCVQRNMKLSPAKFQCTRQVAFGRVTIESCRQRRDSEMMVYLSPEEEKIKNFPDIKSYHVVRSAYHVLWPL